MVSEFGCGAHAGDVAGGARMAARKAGRNVHRRNAGSRRALRSDCPEIDLWDNSYAPFRATDQSGPGRTGARHGAGTPEDLWGESDGSAGVVLTDCGGRARVGDSAGGRGLGRLGSFEYAA